MGSQIMKVVQQIVSQSQQRGGGGRQIIVRNVVAGEDDTGAATATISDSGDTITIATPESLTEQVALTLASAIGDGTILTEAAPETTVTMVTEGEAQEVEVMEQEQFVIAAIPDEMEVQTVVVWDEDRPTDRLWQTERQTTASDKTVTVWPETGCWTNYKSNAVHK